MSTFKMTSYRVDPNDPQSIFTTIEYTFDDTTKLTVEVPHFKPTGIQDVTTNVINRGKTEWAKKVAIAASQNVVDTVLGQYLNISYAFSQT